jgi:hypothetical protein
VLDALADPDRRGDFAEKLKDFAGKIMSAKLHDSFDTMSCSECQGLLQDNYEPCCDQDLRELRCPKGVTKFGNKSILRCTKCNHKYSSEDLAQKSLEEKLNIRVDPSDVSGPLDLHNFWSNSTKKAKRQVMMTIKLLNETVSQMKGGSIPEMNSHNYRDILFITTALRNLHRSDHCRTCFKNGKCECRMKLATKVSDEHKVTFDPKSKDWYDWKGNKTQRELFISEPKRAFVDCFVNVHNEVASAVFSCNTNVIAGVDGGSVIYCTLYVSKNTQKEDNDQYVRVARKVLHKLIELRKQEVEEQQRQTGNSNGEGNNTTQAEQQQDNDNSSSNQHSNSHDNTDEEYSIDHSRKGMRAMISAVMQLTSSHKVAAPMASYLVRNTSRFQFSHKFAWLNINDFEHDSIQDFQCTSDEDNIPFLKSSVANYLYRPKKLDDVCLHDFVSHYNTTYSKVGSMKWASPHPHNNNLRVTERPHAYIPCINYLDFKDSKSFGGMTMDGTDTLQDSDIHMAALENNAKKASICFCPFRNIADLKTDGKFLPKFRDHIREKKLKKKHDFVLKNIQECRNSMNAGRPCDPLERVTNIPEAAVLEEKNKKKDDPIDSYYEELITNINVLNRSEDISFRTQDQKLSVDTSIISKAGSRKCGQRLIKNPSLNKRKSVICTSSAATSSTPDVDWTRDNRRSIKYLTAQELANLHCKITKVITKRDGSAIGVNVTGTLENIKKYAEHSFGGDKEQEQAFLLVASSFVMSLHEKCSMLGKRTRDKNLRDILKLHKGKKQFIGFLSGAGGTGKSQVIDTVKTYCKTLCDNLNVKFDRRTIVVTALTGSAAVSINGETTHSACKLNSAVVTQSEEWDDTIMIIIDEISFAKKHDVESMNKNLNLLKDMRRHMLFGGLHVLFAGDFMQLKPVGAKPLFLFKDFSLWWLAVHTFLELKTNHRFSKDPEHGEMCARFRSEGGLEENDVAKINSRIVCEQNNIYETDLPNGIVIATRTNIDRCAIHDAMFSRHLHNTHSTNPMDYPPLHTVCIMASKICWRKFGDVNTYVPMAPFGKDILYATCGDAHVKRSGGRGVDPMLKLYAGCPVMITDNIAVEKSIANGSMCRFKGITLKDGVSIADLKTIIIDGYHVRSASVDQIKSIEVHLDENVKEGERPRIISLTPENYYAHANFPTPVESTIKHNTKRFRRRIKLTQFPLGIAHARTVHKLQGRSIDNILISTWDYTDNWIYVVLSRCRTLKGIFVRHKLLHHKTRGMSKDLLEFHEHFRATKSPDTNIDENIYMGFQT